MATKVFDSELLDILVCPETKQPVHLAEDDLLQQVNSAIQDGHLTNRGGDPVKDPIDGALVREDGTLLYPIRDEIPIMLIDEAIPLEQIKASS